MVIWRNISIKKLMLYNIVRNFLRSVLESIWNFFHRWLVRSYKYLIFIDHCFPRNQEYSMVPHAIILSIRLSAHGPALWSPPINFQFSWFERLILYCNLLWDAEFELATRENMKSVFNQLPMRSSSSTCQCKLQHCPNCFIRTF